jgi:hypothetical protein
MQNRSIFPYRRHGPKKRVKHGPNRKPRGPQKGLPNSARDLLPLLQPATKALAQVLAGRTGASGQLGHARTMLAQAERMIAERAHNRLTPAEREEFFEQLARLKLTLADADAEAEVQAVEEQEPRPPAPPVAQERLKEMALALSMRERPSQPVAGAPSSPAVEEAAVQEPAGERAAPAAEQTEPSREAAAEPPATTGAGGRGRLVLPKATAGTAAQAVAFGAMARRRSRASRQLAATATEAARAAERAFSTAEGASPAQAQPVEPRAEPHDRVAEHHEGNGAAAEAEDGPRAKSTTRRTRKPKHQGLPEGWVIDEEGFVVPGAG